MMSYSAFILYQVHNMQFGTMMYGWQVDEETLSNEDTANITMNDTDNNETELKLVCL